MIRKTLLQSALLLSLLLASCTRIKEHRMIENSHPSEFNEPIPSEAETSIDTLPTISPTPTGMGFSFEESCYSIQEVSFSEIDFPRRTGILVRNRETARDAIGYLTPYLESPITIFDPSINRGEFLGVSPDGSWILIMLQDESENEDEYPIRRIIVRSSLGDEGWEIASLHYEGDFSFGDLTVTTELGSESISFSDVKFGPGAGWASEDKVYIYSQLAGGTSTSQMFPVITVDIFTGDMEPIFDSYSLGLGEWYLGRYTFDQAPFDLFYSSFDTCPDCAGRFFLYNQFAHEEIPILSWLWKEEWMGWVWTAVSQPLIWQIEDGSVNLLVLRDYGLDVALNLSLLDLKTSGDYQSRMTQLIVPPGSFQSHDQDLLDLGGVYAEWLSTYSSFAIFEGNLAEERNFYLIDFDGLQIREFCQAAYFPMRDPAQTTDGRYIAWERWNGVTSDTLVFDTQTSKVAVVRDHEFVGWAIDSN